MLSLQTFLFIIAALAGPPDSTVRLRAIQHAPFVWNEARIAGEDPVLVAAMVKVETQFDHKAIGRGGERGLMQVQFKLWHKVCPDLLPMVRQPWAQVRCGLRIVGLWKQACRNNRPEAWLGAYNGGTAKCGVGTRYMRKVLRIKARSRQ